MRQLWDGGYLSNTPLRELLTAHKTYWMEYLRRDRSSSSKREGAGDEVMIGQTPELEVYIVNLHPLTPKDIPKDKDLIGTDLDTKDMQINHMLTTSPISIGDNILLIIQYGPKPKEEIIGTESL